MPSFSYEIAMTRDIIQNRMEKIKDIDFLIRGFEILQDNMYGKAGGMFIMFINKNKEE